MGIYDLTMQFFCDIQNHTMCCSLNVTHDNYWITSYFNFSKLINKLDLIQIIGF
jgi:hypothetical protein